VPESLTQQIDRLQDVFFSERDPTGRAFVPLADAYRRVGELDRALEVIEEGLGSNPDFASGHVVAGWVHADRGDKDGAIQAFERVLELDEENAVALLALAEMVEAGRALTYAERLARLEPDDPQVVATLENVRARAAVSPEPEAEAVAPAHPVVDEEPTGRDAIPVEDLAPDGGSAGEVSARAELALEDPDVDAEPAAGGASPDDAEIYTQTLAELYAKQGAVDEAVAVYRKLLEKDPDNGMFLHRVAELTRSVAVGAAPTEEVSAAEMPAVAEESSVAEESAVAARSELVVPIESLAPDPVPLVAGGVSVATSDRPVVSIGSLAPDEIAGNEPDVWAPAQDPVPVQDLAPDPEPDETGRSAFETVGVVAAEETLSVPDDRSVVPIESLAPDEPSGPADDDPFPWISQI